MLQLSHSLNPMARQNNFILVSHSQCSHLCMLHSSQAELQRKKSELARLQRQVLKVSTNLPQWYSSSTHLYFCSLCMTNNQRASHLLLLVSPVHPSAACEAWHWPKHVSCAVGDAKVTCRLVNQGRCDSMTFP